MFNVTVGQKVGYARWHWNTLIQHGTSTVARISAKRGDITLENGKVFDSSGCERSKSYGLALVTIERYEEMIAERDAQRARNANVKDLLSIIEGRKTGHGDYAAFDADTKSRITEILEMLS